MDLPARFRRRLRTLIEADSSKDFAVLIAEEEYHTPGRSLRIGIFADRYRKELRVAPVDHLGHHGWKQRLEHLHRLRRQRQPPLRQRLLGQRRIVVKKDK